MQAVFDAPMGAHDLAEPCRRESRTEKIICGLAADRAVDLAPARDLADGGEARPPVLLLQPADLGRDESLACLDPAMASIDLRLCDVSSEAWAGSSRNSLTSSCNVP